MADCCCPPARATSERECPACGTKGAAVELQTVKALLTPPALARLAITQHRFCADPACPVVYFDDAGQRFSAADVRVPVWQKEPFGKRMICYCFGETEAGIRSDLEGTGTAGAIERVRAHIAATRCACEVHNPQGSCCLGDLLAAVKRVQSTMPGYVL